MELPNLKVKKQAGKYAEFEGKTANELYRNYKAWCKEKNVKAMKFAEWIDWAKDRGLIKETLNADALSSSDKEEVQEAINEVAADNIKDVRRKFGIILFSAIAIGVIIGIASNNSNAQTPGVV
ncbi:MAG TPA: hypothetical protein PK289_04475 [Bacteroidia bacterium]|nr:hypothetical protein [Bacteroidia bacterium]